MMSTLAERPAVEPLRDARRTFTRSRLCAAARDLFATNGFAGTTMEQIAQAAGTQRSTLYNHFRDKTEILAAIAGDYLAGLVALVDILPGPVPDRPQIEAWLDDVAAFTAREQAPTLLFLSLGRTADVPAPLEQLGERLMAALALRLPAFARALEPGEHVCRARALTLLHQLAGLSQQQRTPAMAAAMLTVTAEMFEDFLRKAQQEPS